MKSTLLARIDFDLEASLAGFELRGSPKRLPHTIQKGVYTEPPFSTSLLPSLNRSLRRHGSSNEGLQGPLEDV
jgi:hypothetical protein